MQPHDTAKNESDTKRCTRCGEVKPRSEFSKDRNRKDGLYAYCKKCVSASHRKWYLSNREKVLARTAAYHADHVDEYAVRRKAYAATHRKEIVGYVRAYQSAHPEEESARRAVRNLVNSGRMPSASAHFCFVCGTSADQGAKMHLHHVDYSRPLEVIPVCARCHQRWHAHNPT